MSMHFNYNLQSSRQINMAPSKKTSSVSSSAKPGPKGNTAAAKISKSAKENATTVTQATHSPATKKNNKLELKPAAKPLQARTSSSQGVKDVDIAVILVKVAAQEGLSKYFG
jgi:hypothetical protein